MHLIYKTLYGEILQDDDENCFYCQFKGNTYRLPVCALIAFKSKLNALDIQQMLLTDVSKNEIEIIPLCNREYILVLTVDEIIELKDLVNGALVMLELNSIVHQHMIRASV